MRYRGLTLLILLLLGACAAPRPMPDANHDARSALESTVKVLVSTRTMVGTVEVAESGASGSGTVTDQKATSFGVVTTILTAKHVCVGVEVPDEILALGAHAETTIIVERQDAARFRATVQSLSTDHDLCWLTVNGLVARPIELAKTLPPVGSTVLWAGAPKGLWAGPGRVGFISYGYFAGVDLHTFREPVELFSGAAIPGNSGGGIYFGGRLIGVLIATATSYGQIVLAVPLDTIRAGV